MGGVHAFSDTPSEIAKIPRDDSQLPASGDSARSDLRSSLLSVPPTSHKNHPAVNVLK